MSTPVHPVASQTKRLESIRTAMLTGMIVKLFKNDFTPTPATVLGDITEADFSGYVALLLQEFTGAFQNEAQYAQITGASILSWTQSATTIPNTVFGYYVLDVGGALAIIERFDVPQPMVEIGDKIQIVLRESIPVQLGAAVLEAI